MRTGWLAINKTEKRGVTAKLYRSVSEKSVN